MSPSHRVRPSLLIAALAALVGSGIGCGHREDRQVVDGAPAKEGRSSLPPLIITSPVSTISVDEPTADAQTYAVPVVIEVDDIPEGFWSVSSAEIANAANGTPASRPVAMKPASRPAKGAARPARSTSAATSATSSGSWQTIDAGALVLPSTLHPGRIEMNGRAARGERAEPSIRHIYANSHDLYLLKVPIEYRANAGFDKPLTRIDVTVTLGDVVASSQPASPGMVAPRQPKATYARTSTDWAIKPIKDLGFNGLRYGPNPMPDGAKEYYFIGNQLLGALVADVPYLNAYWSIKASQKQIPGTTDWYAQLLVPKGASRGTITVQAKLWFSPGDEAVVVLPATLIALDLNTTRIAPAKNAPASASSPVAAPTPTETPEATDATEPATETTEPAEANPAPAAR